MLKQTYSMTTHDLDHAFASTLTAAGVTRVTVAGVMAGFRWWYHVDDDEMTEDEIREIAREVVGIMEERKNGTGS